MSTGPAEGFQRILGVRFFDGSPAQAVAALQHSGGYVVVPAAPGMVKLRSDPRFRAALTHADLAIADSGLMVLAWRWLHGRRIRRISGLAYPFMADRLSGANPAMRFLMRAPGKTLWVLPTQAAVDTTAGWLRRAAFPVASEDFYVAPFYENEVRDDALVRLLEERHRANIVIAIGGGPQEKLGLFLRENLNYRPAIHCIGAALGFLTGDQVAIPSWADRFYLGWLFRLWAQPRVFVPRLWSALSLPALVFKYGDKLPALRNPI